MSQRRDNTDPREEEHQGPVIRDKRRIDPTTGEVREPAKESDPATAPGAATGSASGGRVGVAEEEPTALKDQLAERTLDLQRLQAEYANYRKRVERDRQAVREQALANVLSELLPVLDDIGRARDHGELTGGFKQVAEALETTVGKLGLERFGAAGEPFDPAVHEALMHSYSEEVSEPTAVEILQPGYTVAGRILRPARVAVAEPAESIEPAEPTEAAEPAESAADVKRPPEAKPAGGAETAKEAETTADDD